MEEVWKDIECYCGLYQVSNLGRIMNVRHVAKKNGISGRILAVGIGEKGYAHVTLCDGTGGKAGRKTRRVAAIVAKAFIDNPDGKPEVNHINGIRTDNRAENLEWCTRSENELHAYRSLGKRVYNERAVRQFTLSGVFVAEYPTMTHASEVIGGGRGHITSCCTGKRRQAGGFIWKYADR